MVYECLSLGTIDPCDINNVKSAFKAKLETHLKIQGIRDVVWLGLINQPTRCLKREPMDT